MPFERTSKFTYYILVRVHDMTIVTAADRIPPDILNCLVCQYYNRIM